MPPRNFGLIARALRKKWLDDVSWFPLFSVSSGLYRGRASGNGAKVKSLRLRHLFLGIGLVFYVGCGSSSSDTTSGYSISIDSPDTSTTTLSGKFQLHTSAGVSAPIVPGNLNLEFGDNGAASIALPADTLLPSAVLQGTQRILFATSVKASGVYGAAIYAMTMDGALDTSFNSGEPARFTFPGVDIVSIALAVQNDGKILLFVNADVDQTVVIRFSADGILDTSFNGVGYRVVAVPGTPYRAGAMALQSDGKIIVSAAVAVPGAPYVGIALQRINTDGTFDDTFGLAFGEDGTNVFPTDLLVQPDGKIVSLGLATTSGHEGYSLERFLTNGTFDPDFSGGVLVDKTQPWVTLQGSRMALQDDGKILVAGYLIDSQTTSGSQIIAMMARQLPSGPSDDPFGTLPGQSGGLGAIGYRYQTSATVFRRVALQTDQSILGLGDASDSTTGHSIMLLNRRDIYGVNDSFFADNGVLVFSSSGKDLVGVTVLIPNSTKALAVGNDGSIFVRSIQTNGLQSVMVQSGTQDPVSATVQSDGSWSVPLTGIEPGNLTVTALYSADGVSSTTVQQAFFCVNKNGFMNCTAKWI